MQQHDFSALNVLIIDDHRHFRSIMRAVLQGLGVQNLYEAEDVAGAYHLLKVHSIDVAFVDINIPEVGGLDFIDLVRSAPDCPCKRLPIIVVSSDTRRSMVEEAIGRGADNFLIKPINSGEIQKRIIAVTSQLDKEISLEDF